MPEESVVIYRLGSMGDTVVALPCFHGIERAFPRARKVVLTNLPVAQNAAPVELILRGSGLADEFISYGIGLRHPEALIELRRTLRELNARTLVYLASTTPPRDRYMTILRDAIFFRLCGFRTIIGIPITRELRLLRVDAATGLLEREAERLARCMVPLGPIDLDDPAFWDLRLTADEIRVGRKFIARLTKHGFVVVHVGGKVSSKDWGDANWSAVFQRISKMSPGLGLLLVGSADENKRNELLMANWAGPVLNAAGQLSPRVSAAAIRQAKLFIGHDSGPMHLAAALGIPCLALFGDNNLPRMWHPLGPNRAQTQVIQDMLGIRNIERGRVIALAEHMLGLATHQARI